MVSREPPRILHVFRAPLGGLFRHVVDLAREQTARGLAVGLFCDSTTGNEQTAAILDGLAGELALGVRRVPMQRNPGMSDVTVMRALAHTVRETQATILHGHGSKGGAYARSLPDPRGRHLARFYTPHGGSFHYKTGTTAHGIYMAVERFLARRTDGFLFESAFIAERFSSAIGPVDSPIHVIHNGLTPAEFEPVTPAADLFDLLYIGEMRAAKGLDTLIEALGLLRASGRWLTLLAVGSGHGVDELKALAAQKGVADAVVFEGPQPIRSVLGRARAMVVPSRKESLPYVILEAAAAGHPVISTNVGGIPEIFAPLREELIAPGEPETLAQAILAKLDEPASTRIAKCAVLRAHVRNRFAIARMVDGILAAYAAAGGDNERPAPR